MDDPRIGKRIRESMAANGVGAKELAAKIGVHPRTITRARQGKGSRDTLESIDKVLGEGGARQASEDHGGYSENDYNHYIGHYLSYRRSFISRQAIVVSHMKIDWPPSKSCLCFHLRRIQDNPVSNEVIRIYREGEIYIRRNLGFVHFVSYDKGEVRLITTWSLRDEGDKTLEGMVLTLTESNPLYPAASPIIIQKQETRMSDEEVDRHIGVFPCNHAIVAEMSERLERLFTYFSNLRQ